MLKKLLKYDLKWCFKPLIIFYILALFFSLLTRFTGCLDKSLVFVVINKICIGIVISMIINIFINCYMRNWARLVRNIYKDESYLTHTLPVTKNQLFLSKVLCSIITLLCSFIVILICLSIIFLNKDSWILFKTFLEQSAILLDSSVFIFISVIAFTIFFQSLCIIAVGYLGIIIGHRSNNYKIIKSIIYGFLLYILVSLLNLGSVYIIGLFNKDILNIFYSTTINSSIFKNIMIIIIVIYLILILSISLISNRLLNKGVNVD